MSVVGPTLNLIDRTPEPDQPERHNMTDETPAMDAEDQSADEAGAGSIYDVAPPADGMLDTLAGALNDSESGSVSLTMSVNGAIISGMMIGRDAWMAKQVELTADTPLAETVAMLSKMSTIASMTEAFPDFDEWYVHLEDARYLLGGRGGSLPTSGGMLVRVRMSEIDSWTFGVFRSDNDSDDE
jgi:hypothetical protein